MGSRQRDNLGPGARVRTAAFRISTSKVAVIRNSIVLFAAAAVIVACTTITDEPELPGTGPVVHRLETETHHSIYGMVAAANPESSRIAVDVLEAGGNAVDAAVAAAFALGVSDPGDGGLGGAIYILIRFADGRSTVIDGSAAVPLRVDRNRLAEIQAAQAESGIELAAVPASLAALAHAAKRYGTRSLADLIEPSIELAKGGYHATPFQEVSITTYFEDVMRSDYLRYFMLDNGEEPPSVDTLQCRPVLANTLRRIAVGGTEEFYRGSIADEIESDMDERGGFVDRDDLALLRVRELTPLRGSYRNVEVLAVPYPSLGGAVIQALNILEQYPSDFLDLDSVDRLQVLTEAFHIAIADHERVSGHTASVTTIGWEHLLAKEFAAERAALIQLGRALVNDEFPADQQHRSTDGNTAQVSVVDRWGNAVSLTHTLGRFFGNKVANPSLGFPYNSLLEGEADPKARAPIPTSMCPSIVLKDGEVLLVLGSGASNRIPGIVATVISNIVDRKLGLREAVLAPRVLWGPYKGFSYYAEIFHSITKEQVDELGTFGYEPILRARLPTRLSGFSRFGSVNAVHFDRESRVMTGVGDPRRNGTALGARF
jgi:gamma-glutamyltranspeptidase/glutathione hydrolase